MFRNLSVILQGALSPRTASVIDNWRKSAPGCEIVLSTWTHDPELETRVDSYVVSADPGTFPVMHGGKILRTENTNRQIVSSMAGLCKATRAIAIKWRTDFDFCPALMNKFLSQNLPLIEDGGKVQLVVFSINSTNPFAGASLVAQLSDWMYFGRTDFLTDLLPVAPIPATPENIEIPPEALAARIFPIARFSAEQWMLREGFERVYGIALNRFDDPGAISPFLRLVGKSILVINPRSVGLITSKYDHLFSPRWKTLRAFIGFRLSTISQLDSALLGISFLRPFAIGLLKFKGQIFDMYKVIAEQLRS